MNFELNNFVISRHSKYINKPFSSRFTPSLIESSNHSVYTQQRALEYIGSKLKVKRYVYYI